jgi:hypothetical protein
MQDKSESAVSAPLCRPALYADNMSFDSFHLERALVSLIANAIEDSNKNWKVSMFLVVDKTISIIIIADIRFMDGEENS